MVVTKLEDFIDANKKFLQLEKLAEDEQNRLLIETHTLNDLCKAGVALKKLKVVHHRTSFAGRVEAKFASSRSIEPLPAHKLTPGDIVNLCQSSSHQVTILSGVVSKINETSVSVAFDSWDEEIVQPESRTFCLVMSVNDVTYRRLQKTLDLLSDYGEYPGGAITEYLFGRCDFPSPCLDDSSLKTFDNNPAAAEAVRFCLNSSRPVSIIHGPPGTGKTTTVVEIIKHAIKTGVKILACAPSNVAVDNILERLVDAQVKAIRIGHPARTHAKLREYCLDHILKCSDQASLIDDIRHELDELTKKRGKTANERKALKKELERREAAALGETLSNAQVICCTLTSATKDGPLGSYLKHRHFDCVIIDECAQATELACWSALLWGTRCILAGDHNQLAPTIISDKAAEGGYSRTLMRRIVDEFPKTDLVRLLIVQYRMNKTIMDWASAQIYDNKLEADNSVESHLLSHLPGVTNSEETSCPFMIIDTADCSMDEIKTVDDESKANIGEIKLVYVHISRLISSGVPATCIAAISPYNLQVQLLRLHVGTLFPGLAIRTVDGFQGQEREAVVLSLVRSNKKGELGFLKDRKRINVSVTRARRHLAVVGDGGCISSDPIMKSLIDHANDYGIVKSAVEYEDDLANIPFEVEVDSILDVSSSSSKPNRDRDQTINKTKEKKSKPHSASKPAFVASKAPSVNVSERAESEDFQVGPEDIWRENLITQLQQFLVDSSSVVLEFPSDLQSYERRFVHEFAEENHLIHYSKGESNDRRITVEKPREKILDAKISQVKNDVVVKPEEISSTKPKVKKSAPENSSGPSPRAKQQTNLDNLDDDQLIEKFKKEESRCKFPKCKQPVMVLGLSCQFCVQKFCFNHGMPEIHGCGEEARKKARADVRATLSGVKGPVVRTEDNQRKAVLKSKLDDQIKKVQDKRTKLVKK